MKLSSLVLVSTSLLLTARSLACDLCGCYLPPQEHIHKSASGIYAGISEQFTHFGSLRFDGREVDNPTDQYLDSSITQLVVGSSFLDDRFSFQVNVPFIHRSYKRPEGFDIKHGDESGLGDVSLLANFVVFKKDALFHEESGSADGKTAAPVVRQNPDFTASFNLIAGIKVPTGDSGRLKEEFEEGDAEPAPESETDEHGGEGAPDSEAHEHEHEEAPESSAHSHGPAGAPESGTHGHDLALGTGSYDAILGAQLFLRYKAVFFQADAQFTLRGDGRYSYHFANDLTWSGGPGVYLIRHERGSLGLQCVVSGEHKDTDRFQGRTAEDTGITSLYVGPRVTAQFRRVTADVGLDLPALLDNTALQAVPDYRIRAAVSIHF